MFLRKVLSQNGLKQRQSYDDYMDLSKAKKRNKVDKGTQKLFILESRPITQQEEFRRKNILKEVNNQELRDSILYSIDTRNHFLKTQRINNYRNEMERLIGAISTLTPGVRYFKPQKQKLIDLQDTIEQEINDYHKI